MIARVGAAPSASVQDCNGARLKLRRVKAIAERLFDHRFHIERTSDRNEVQALLTLLRPRSPTAPLIRVGAKHDGGYLLPDDLDGITACISPGVSFEVGFDLAIADRAIDVFMIDASVDGPPQQHPKFHFTKQFLDVFEDDTHTRLDRLCKIAGTKHAETLMLQMDIEGAEWRVLLDASPATISQFRIMVIEFHNLDLMASRFTFQLIKATFLKLLQTHSVVHLHPNNTIKSLNFYDLEIPPIMEFTFYSKERAFSGETRRDFPHPLDADCVPTKESLPLPKCWR